jgi:glycoside/pentoside/hexuronide:cation symporter, GPH family
MQPSETNGTHIQCRGAPGLRATENGPRPDHLPLSRKTGYGAGQLVEMIVESMQNVFILFYATAVCGLPGGLAGLAIGAGIVADAIMNPFIGSLSDGWRSRFGRRVPFMAASLVPILVTFNLLFALPTGLGQTALFLWLTFLSISLRISLSLFTVPYQALGAQLTDDYQERSSVAAWRWGIGILGTAAVVGLGYGVFFAGPGGVSRRDAYLPFTLTLSILLLAGALVAIRQGLTARDVQHEIEPPTEAIHHRLIGEIREMFSSRTFRILFAAGLLFNIQTGLSQALGLHVATFFWQLSSGQIQGLGLATVFGLATAAPFAGSIAQRIEKRTMVIIGVIGMILCQILPATLKLLGLLPFTGDGLIAFLATMGFVGGALMASTLIAFVSIVPDAADEHELLFGTQRQGLYFAGWSFATKTATGAGVLIAGVALQLVNFPAHISEQDTAVALPERMMAWLAIAHGPAASLLSLAAVALMLLYRIDKRRHARIIADLTERTLAAHVTKTP